MVKRAEQPMSEAMYYILLALTEPLHGYAIMEEVSEISNGRIELGPGTLYGILKRLQHDNWIELKNSDGRRKVYQMTAIGKTALKQEYERLSNLVKDGEVRIQGGKYEWLEIEK